MLKIVKITLCTLLLTFCCTFIKTSKFSIAWHYIGKKRDFGEVRLPPDKEVYPLFKNVSETWCQMVAERPE